MAYRSKASDRDRSFHQSRLSFFLFFFLSFVSFVLVTAYLFFWSL